MVEVRRQLLVEESAMVWEEVPKERLLVPELQEVPEVLVLTWLTSLTEPKVLT